MNRMMHLLLSMMLLAVSAWAVAAGNERTVKPVQFPKGETATTISGSIRGHHFIDYQLRAAAGQTMKINLRGSNRANYFNLLPPGSSEVAMALGDLSGNRFDGLLPDDGVYTIRVFLVRAAARRNEASDFKLSVGIEGVPLKPISAKGDAVLPGTRYNASATVPCSPALTNTRQCEALVIRRSHDGTATVELRWDKNGTRRILFIKGEPKAADVPQAMTFTRNERGWKVMFNADEYFEIPEPLVTGG